MTILEKPKAPPKRDQSRAFDLWHSKYPQLEISIMDGKELLFGQIKKDNKLVSIINFAMYSEKFNYSALKDIVNVDLVVGYPAEDFIDAVGTVRMHSVPWVHFAYVPSNDILLYQTIWKNGRFRCEIKIMPSQKHQSGEAKIYLDSPNIIEGHDD
jgi:hypothetical protein